MRPLLVFASLLATALLAPGASAFHGAGVDDCLFGYDPEADVNVCYEVGTYGEPSYVYEVGINCRLQVGTQCFGEPTFTPIAQGPDYDVPYAAVYLEYDGPCPPEFSDADPPTFDELVGRCAVLVSTASATGIVFNVGPL